MKRMPRNPMMSLAANAMRRGQTAWIAAVARAAVPDQPKPPAKPKRRKAR